MVIIDVGTLKTTEYRGMRLPTKGYGFNKFDVLVELKLRRRNGKSNNQFLNDIAKERNKIVRLREDLRGGGSEEFIYYMIIFDKKENLYLRTEENANHKEYYVYST